MVEDILAEQAQAILVVESPHYEEVDTGIPLSGDSGKVVSRVLIGMDCPIGPLCQTRRVKLSIVETFRQPLQALQAHEQRPTLLEKIHSLEYRSNTYKDELKRIFRENKDTHIFNDYANRISAALTAAPIKRLVICGMIAQSVFEHVFAVRQTKSTQPFHCTLKSHTAQAFYIWHPSQKAGKDKDGKSRWETPDNAKQIIRLKSFVSARTLLAPNPEQHPFSEGKKSMNKIVQVKVTLDDNVPEYMGDIIRCATVQSFDAYGQPIKDHQDIIDNTEYHSTNEMISDISARLGVAKNIIEILE